GEGGAGGAARGAGSLAAGASDGGTARRFRPLARAWRRSAGAALGEDQLGVEPADLGLVEALTGRCEQRLALVEPLACLGEAAGASHGRGEVGEMGRLPEAPPDGRRPGAPSQAGAAPLELAVLHAP